MWGVGDEFGEGVDEEWGGGVEVGADVREEGGARAVVSSRGCIFGLVVCE